MSTKAAISEKIKKIVEELDASFVERRKAVRLCLLAMFSGEHVVLLGPPGTAKSLLARTICEAIQGGTYFDYLLTRFTTPDEIFGPLSIKKLEQDIYERQTQSYLPSAHIAFLDEIFKANSSILNSLLTLINERMFHNGSQLMEVPLRSIFGASNETPEDETLNALYDRFLVRILVNFVEGDEAFSSIIFGKAGAIPIETKFTIKELESLSNSARSVKVPKTVQEMILVLKRKLVEIGVVLSDRRWKQLVGFLKTMAAASNRRSVQEIDILILQDMLWDEPSQIDGIRSVVWETVVAAKYNAESLLDDINRTREVFEDAHIIHVKKKDQWDRETGETQKRRKRLTPVSLKMYMNQIREIEKSMKSARKSVSDRRRKYESQLSGNTWIAAPRLIEDVEKEITELSSVDDKLVELHALVNEWPRKEQKNR